jgi:hypothetical protein
MDPIVHIDEYDFEYDPDDFNGIVANIGDPELNNLSTSTLPSMSIKNVSGKPLSKYIRQRIMDSHHRCNRN